MFRAADLVLLSKCDLLDFIDDFDPGAARERVLALANPAAVLEISARRPDSLENWLNWLHGMLAARGKGQELSPKIQSDGAALHPTG